MEKEKQTSKKPNSIEGLIERGFYAEGPLIENNVDSIVREGIEYKVIPISTTFYKGTSKEKSLIVFKPVSRSESKTATNQISTRIMSEIGEIMDSSSWKISKRVKSEIDEILKADENFRNWTQKMSE